MSDESEPAFPCPPVWMPNHEQLSYSAPGLTKREYFAAAALSAFKLSLLEVDIISETDIELFYKRAALNAYKYADAMIEEGNK